MSKCAETTVAGVDMFIMSPTWSNKVEVFEREGKYQSIWIKNQLILICIILEHMIMDVDHNRLNIY